MSKSTSDGKFGYCYKLFRVRRGSDNGITTVSMDPALTTLACRTLGGLPAVSELVREFSLEFDKQASETVRNRSGFVSTQLLHEVQRRQTQQNDAKLKEVSKAELASA